jgi:cysteine/O-acetylserine efflux protein
VLYSLLPARFDFKEGSWVGIQWLPFLSFVVVTTFTPGPNNISAMSIGISYGYRNSLKYLTGISLGFFIVMCLCAIVDRLLIQALPRIEPYLRIASSLYIVWLAIQTFLGSLKATAKSQPPLRFHDGLLLQLLNPKVIAYGLTLYSSFLLASADTIGRITLSAAGFAAVGFASVSVWALAGSSFAHWFKRPLVQRIASGILALLLLYSAVETSGLIKGLH